MVELKPVLGKVEPLFFMGRFLLDSVRHSCATFLVGLLCVIPLRAAALEPIPGHDHLLLPPISQPPASVIHSGDPLSFYRSEVDAFVQQNCVVCHRSGGTAETNGARLILGSAAEGNHEAFEAFIAIEGVEASRVLSKVTGQLDHGGGQVTSAGSAFYVALETYLAQLSGGNSTSQSANFWEGTRAESREVTLRRATLLFAGKVATPEAIAAARRSESALRAQILAAMKGDGFREFILAGANDRLLVEGLLNGIDFNITTRDRFPAFSDFLRTLPKEKPEEFQDYHDFPFLSKNDADWDFRWAITREPLELIAHVITTDKPYKQILTADYTMVNAFSNLAYRAEAKFPEDFADEQGFYDRRRFDVFKPGRNVGHIPHDIMFLSDEYNGVTRFSGYQEWPHSGVLTTQAWLARYPSTDTNRNRARARWTYFHFLGVDIEKSAPRTTDPVALADTNNPTMKNSACTVCHERLDPVAGAYQSFGDFGHYLDQHGGQDSLSDSYKCPECYGGEQGSTEYQLGDTWYRDMRVPGFEGKAASGQRDSVQWLGYQIANDPRFASATVRFWWPAVFGADTLVAPADPDGPDYDQRLRAYNEQDVLIGKLAEQFEASGFSAKSLFADMVMSNWYRHSEVDSKAIATARSVELATVGSGRLLTPEELDRKTRALFGNAWREWGEGEGNPHAYRLQSGLSSGGDFQGFYGGIDGAAVTTRNRELTPLMSNVTESMATDLACYVVVKDFHRPTDQRFIFKYVERETVPGLIVDAAKALSGKVSEHNAVLNHTITFDAELVGGPTLVRVEDLTENSYGVIDSAPAGDRNTNADLTVIWVSFRQGGREIKRIDGRYLTSLAGFRADQFEDQEGQLQFRGDVRDEGWRMHEQAWLEFLINLPAGKYEVQAYVGTSLLDNNINDQMTARISLHATENLERTQSGQAMVKQIRELVLDATNRGVGEDEAVGLMNVIVEHAKEQSLLDQQYYGNHGSCWYGPEANYNDRRGMMRGWVVLIHYVMTSFGYLHD